MANGDWTDKENDLIVADYFAMLADDSAGRPYNKAEHNRHLQQRIDRSRTSIEFKHQNISAVLKGLGEDWIPGYKPAFNFQLALVDAVARWLARNPAWLGRVPDTQPAPMPSAAAQLWVGPPPTLSNQPPPQELERDAVHRPQVRRCGPGRAQPRPRPRRGGARAGATSAPF